LVPKRKEKGGARSKLSVSKDALMKTLSLLNPSSKILPRSSADPVVRLLQKFRNSSKPRRESRLSRIL